MTRAWALVQPDPTRKVKGQGGRGSYLGVSLAVLSRGVESWTGVRSRPLFGFRFRWRCLRVDRVSFRVLDQAKSPKISFQVSVELLHDLARPALLAPLTETHEVDTSNVEVVPPPPRVPRLPNSTKCVLVAAPVDTTFVRLVATERRPRPRDRYDEVSRAF